jgi:hypothetical protein
MTTFNVVHLHSQLIFPRSTGKSLAMVETIFFQV